MKQSNFIENKYLKACNWVSGKTDYQTYPISEFKEMINLKKHKLYNVPSIEWQDIVAGWLANTVCLRKHFNKKMAVSTYINKSLHNYIMGVSKKWNLKKNIKNKTHSIFNEEGEIYIETEKNSYIPPTAELSQLELERIYFLKFCYKLVQNDITYLWLNVYLQELENNLQEYDSRLDIFKKVASMTNLKPTTIRQYFHKVVNLFIKEYKPKYVFQDYKIN